MADHIDKAGIRCLITAISLFLFLIIVWGPVNTIWIGPWIYDGARLGSLAWRKAWVLNGWILMAPIVMAFGYCIFTMSRAIRKDASERSNRRAS
jgi:hypothetical protein